MTRTQEKLAGMIRETAKDGRIFGVSFNRRSDGANRNMLARLGVSKGTSGVGMSYSPAKKNLLVVHEMPQGRFRSIPVEGITSVTVDGVIATKR